MANTIKQRPLEPIMAELSAKGFDPLGPLCIALRDIITRADKIANNNGEIQAKANVTGRTEPLSTTVTNITNTGTFNSLANVANTNTDFLTDGTGSPIAGGKRGFVALDTNNRLANSFRANPVNVSNAPTSSTTLTNDGVSTSTTIAAYTNQFPPGTVSYNSGSVDLGSFGSQYIYFDDPTFAGGAVAYAFTTSPQVQTAAEGRTVVGQITTVGGTAKTGGGTSGGTGGKPGGHGFIQG
jgi:hypothetical protein